jgi:hypothetical protein
VKEADVEVFQILGSWAVTLPAVAWIIVRDERRLRGRQLENAWPPSSRDAAIYALWNFGVHHLSVLIHFVRTRRSLRGVGLGLAWLTAVVAADLAAQLLVAWVIGLLGL